ncbi:MAG TPA: sensor histidine kinase [Gaiellaceae bacterium]|jgi:signal transduction histidine kinase|nr:sensor histidine kinase [Gaiellaceae bacterium]
MRARALQLMDPLIAVAIFVASLADLLKAGTGSGWGGPRALELLVALGISLPLLWRRTHPELVLLVVLAASVGSVALVAPRQAAFEAFLSVLIAFYSVGSHVGGRRSYLVAGLATAFVVVAGIVSQAVGWEDNGNGLPTGVFALAAWIIGTIIRSWRERAAELEEQRDLQASAAVAVERGRIARELHDVIAHNISMIVVQAGAAAHVLEGEQPEVRAALDAIETTGRETVDEMRHLLGVLRRADDGQALAPQPGLASLGALVAQVNEAGLPVELTVEGTPQPLPPGLDLSAYRIAQEGLTNALKHAGPAHATLRVTYAPNAVEIEIRDDGARGAPGTGTGHGLVGMRERVALWGGKLQVGPEAGGWVVRAWLPIGAHA